MEVKDGEAVAFSPSFFSCDIIDLNCIVSVEV